MGGREDASSATSPISGITCVEMMPVAEFPGRFGWGYDGVNLFAPTHLYGEPDDLRRFVDEAHGHGLGRHPRRRLQPPRPRRQLSPRVLPGLLHRPAPDGLGRGHQLRRSRLGAGARVLPRQCARCGSTSSTSTAFASTPRRASSTSPTSTCWPRSAARCGPRRGDARRSSSPRTSRSRRAWSARRSAAATGSTALWNDDLHHCGDGRPHGQARGLLHRLPGLASGADLGGEVGLSLPGAALQVAAEPPRHAGARSAALRPSSPSSRTTIRSPIPPTASACTR